MTAFKVLNLLRIAHHKYPWLSTSHPVRRAGKNLMGKSHEKRVRPVSGFFPLLCSSQALSAIGFSHLTSGRGPYGWHVDVP